MSDSEHHSDEPELPAEPRSTLREKAMGFWGHLEELRWTLVKSALVFTVFAVFIGSYLQEFQDVLMWPFVKVKSEYPAITMVLGTQTIIEGFNVVMQMCIFGGLIMAAPFILFFVGQFVAPALNERETKAVLPLMLSALVLFLAGAGFSFFYLVPSTLRMAVEINTLLHYDLRWTPASYFSLLTWLVLGVGAGFEFPLVIVLLVWLGIVSTAFLRKYRRHSFVLCFIIAAIVTPTPDPIVMTMFALPLYFLYEVAIIAAGRVEKKKAARFN